MEKREQAWVVGLTAIYLLLAFLLMILLNPNTDKQSRDQTRVFFTASHYPGHHDWLRCDADLRDEFAAL
jgi:hypothetical protein